jgi:chemotaxis protein methyltransferase CheR
MRLLLDERFADALRILEEEPAQAARPAPRELLLRGVLLAHAGRLADAEMVCRRLLDDNGLDADAHHQLAVCLEGGAAVDVAIGHYRLAAYLDPDFAMPRLRLGLLARRRGENRIAGPELERALTLLRQERDERITLFGGGFGRIALTTLCRAELDACGAYR